MAAQTSYLPRPPRNRSLCLRRANTPASRPTTSIVREGPRVPPMPQEQPEDEPPADEEPPDPELPPLTAPPLVPTLPPELLTCVPPDAPPAPLAPAPPLTLPPAPPRVPPPSPVPPPATPPPALPLRRCSRCRQHRRPGYPLHHRQQLRRQSSPRFPRSPASRAAAWNCSQFRCMAPPNTTYRRDTPVAGWPSVQV